MGMAIGLAVTDPIPFGAVLVDRKTGEVVGCGQNRSFQHPTRHAEIVAIDDYLSRAGPLAGVAKAILGLRETALYTTAEPCPMCMGAIVWARIPELCYGASIPFLVANGHMQIDVRAAAIAAAVTFEKPSVVGGVLEGACNALYRRLA
jgi:tRNA(Arg) A34 adenosine deaminase TadA